MKLHELILWQKLGLTIYGKTRYDTKRYIYQRVVASGFGMHLVTDENGIEYLLRYKELLNGYSYDISLFENGIWDFGTPVKLYVKLWDRVKYTLGIIK